MGVDLIYDLGAHEGLNLPYYLVRAKRVVAVEANAQLADGLRVKFAEDIKSGKLVVVEAAIVGSNEGPTITFWLNSQNSVLSSLVEPLDSTSFKAVTVPTISVSELFKTYGNPDFVKVDLEGFDVEIITEMFRQGVTPESMQVEGWNPAVFGVLAGVGLYGSFKVVNGPEVAKRYKNHPFVGSDGRHRSHSFPYHSAGSIGDEVDGPWFSGAEIFKLIGLLGPGWYDIHASNRSNAPLGLRVGKGLLISTLFRRLADKGSLVKSGARNTWNLNW